MSVLPIDALETQFNAALADGHVVVAAATGSGKSTRLPQWAAREGRVLVVEPRRVACVALASHVAQLLGGTLGERAGYSIRFDHCVHADTEIVFVTPGVALRWFSENRLAGFDTVILDEFHERRWDIDLLLALLKVAQAHRLVLTSATFNAEKVAHYIDAQLLTASGRCFDVVVEHVADDPRQMPSTHSLEQRVVDQVHRLLECVSGDILVFLPGRGEIARVKARLGAIVADVLILHAGISREQQQVLVAGTTQRVVLATNVAETSLTIPGITVVIDAGLERRTHQRNGRTVLGLHAISRASADQRSGRAGRTAPGRCIRLWGQHAPLEAATPPEVEREELAELVLAAAAAGYQAKQLQFISPLPEKSLLIAMRTLQAMAALDERGEITPHGRTLFPLPIDTQFAHLISAMPDETLKGAMADLCAALSFSRWLAVPQSELALKALTEWQPVPCDALTLLAALRGRTPPELAVDNHVRDEARQLSQQVRRALMLGPIPETIDFDRNDWLCHVIRALPSLAYVRREKRRHAMGNGFREVTIGERSRMPDDAEAAIVFDDYALPGKGTRQTLVYATCLAPLALRALHCAGIGEPEMGEIHYEECSLEVAMNYRYAGRVIAQEIVTPQGACARAALATLIASSRLMPGVADRLRDDIEAWALYVALGDADGEVPEPQQWLCERLTLLGVESVEDMMLIEASDLRFEGIPAWQRTDFDERYPRELVLGDLRLSITYDVSRRCVIAERLSGLRKEDPKRWEFPAWRGWKIQYKKASRRVDIR